MMAETPDYQLHPGALMWCRYQEAFASRGNGSPVVATLWCGQIPIADAWFIAEGVIWQIRSTPEIGLVRVAGYIPVPHGSGFVEMTEAKAIVEAKVALVWPPVCPSMCPKPAGRDAPAPTEPGRDGPSRS
jgi:hypothetical protein